MSGDSGGSDAFERSQERLEAEEDGRLGPCATRSRGASRRVPQSREGRLFAYRTEFQRDRDRILHAERFARLAGVGAAPGGLAGLRPRTRLAHALEVAQLGRTLARVLGLNEDLVEAVALGRQLGMPPFAATGLAVLDDALRGRLPDPGGSGRIDVGGFDVGSHALRVVDVLECHGQEPGLNLTEPVREGIARAAGEPWPGDLRPARGEGETAPGPEAQVVGLAEALAEPLGRVGDALLRGDCEMAEVSRLPVAREVIRRLGDRHDDAEPGLRRVLLLRGLTHLLVASAARESADAVRSWCEARGIRRAHEFSAHRAELPPDLVRLPARGLDFAAELGAFVDRRLDASPSQRRRVSRAARLVRGAFVVLAADPLLAPDPVLERHAELTSSAPLRALGGARRDEEIELRYRDRPPWLRAVADHVAGLTEAEARDLARAVTGP